MILISYGCDHVMCNYRQKTAMDPIAATFCEEQAPPVKSDSGDVVVTNSIERRSPKQDKEKLETRDTALR